MKRCSLKALKLFKEIMKSLVFTFYIVFLFYPLCAQNNAYIATDKAIEDLDSMIKMIEEVHYNPYFKVSKEQFKQNKKELLQEFSQDSITLKQFIATGMKLVSQMSGGHTVMDWQNPNIIPELTSYQFLPFSGKLINNHQDFVVTRSSILEIPKGTYIKSINGVSIIDLYKECMSYLGGIESFKRVSCEKVLPLYLFFTDKIEAPYAIKINDVEQEVKTKGIEASELNTLMRKNQVESDYTFEIRNHNIGLISYNKCNDYDAFDVFLKDTFKTIKEKNITKLIIDIRENGGGDSALNDLLLSYITTTPYRQSSGRFWKVSNLAKTTYKSNPVYEKHLGKEFLDTYTASENQSIIEDLESELTQPIKPKNFFDGTSCVLIGPITFSSANFLADAVKTYKLSTLIGEATGEYTNDFGELLSFTLPNSGNYVYVSSTYDIGANGDSNVYEPVHPDIKVEDDALAFAINWIRIKE